MGNEGGGFEALQWDDPQVAGGYRLVARLGAGGMGRVYLAYTRGGRAVAVKVVRPELADDPVFRKRFHREVKAARRVQGAYTAELVDADADGVPPWLATLYVPGPSLSQLVARRGALPVSAVLWLMAGVAEALQAIHEVGVVHRDLKPSNVLLASDGPRVIDFGISTAPDSTVHTTQGATIGTPQFMAPEQASAGEITPAADVFSLGQTVAFAVLGEPLYGSGTALNVMYRIVNSEPDLSALPGQLRPILARCLAADPAERATPAEVVAWCRRELGPEADTSGGPEVWREVVGPPVPAPEPVSPVVPTLSATSPWAPPPEVLHPSEVLRAGRRRTRLIAGVGALMAVPLLAALAWLGSEISELNRDRAGASSSAAPSPSASGKEVSEKGLPEGAAGGKAAGSADQPSSGPPEAVAHPLVRLDEKNSISLDAQGQRDDRKGDVRLVCGNSSCTLRSSTSAMSYLPAKPTNSYEECRTYLAGASTRGSELSLVVVAEGSRICVKHRSGAIGMLVIQIKSTYLPDSGVNFLMGDLTVWPTS
ncbi:serine/threonine-protein kinase [Streptomyces acidiscabies]|uniref:Serine/threonine-protein kinase n=1 Tax=Streptomyces acidiscabies TaxID=42234 RepID=A0AAP6EG14_9ACTN|nr:serine/threonine-protein kinase [Streptomyces acidiscabies]MDX2961592.1 serine/threonine-protein kinase [Streptomyces acidiscabies]MDX3016540.1 serine/threonine-protein kinase [Streptomyces acidiscabies]MDX3788555.1 serine/threonine-protein kinase [Streptomyces acidiscabies]GAQ52291.1 serine/threonine-protein kinase AfsK [Streptomyces acidiscabies]GAV41367.1 serine/threonine-protein kinase AfsK [Streptomyces acidiscabies]